MLEMLKARKEALQAEGKKGFTLMEMLIVIAIIAVLIAIAIPVFTSQLAAADKAVDEANIRSGYAQLQSDIALNKPSLTESEKTSGKEYYLKSDGTTTDTKSLADYTAKSTAESNEKIGGLSATWNKDELVKYTVKEGTDGMYRIDSITAGGAKQ